MKKDLIDRLGRSRSAFLTKAVNMALKRLNLVFQIYFSKIL